VITAEVLVNICDVSHVKPLSKDYTVQSKEASTNIYEEKALQMSEEDSQTTNSGRDM
jgi:hypothetical protein